MKTYRINPNQTVEKRLITPDIAKEMLSIEAVQRDVVGTAQRSYEKSMRAETWNFNTGETLAIDERGGVIQGQHRLHALISAGIAAEFFVAINTPQDAFSYMDQGAKRTATDVFKLHGYPQPPRFSSIARRIMEFDVKTHRLRTLGRVNNYEVLKFAELRRARIESCLKPAASVDRIMTGSLAGMVCYLLEPVDADKLAHLMAGIAKGDRLDPKSPVLALRNKLIDLRSSTKDGLSVKNQLPYVIYTWNLLYDGRSFTRWQLPDKQLFEGAPTPDHASFANWI